MSNDTSLRILIYILTKKIMKLNIVTAASNSVGQAILEKIANPVDMTIGLSRK